MLVEAALGDIFGAVLGGWVAVPELPESVSGLAVGLPLVAGAIELEDIAGAPPGAAGWVAEPELPELVSGDVGLLDIDVCAQAMPVETMMAAEASQSERIVNSLFIDCG